jgi:2-polyprenyl-6-methoxyphenol hydroxylase-like FAD-dependent oxidoreductase
VIGQDILIVGGGIGGLTSAIALGLAGYPVTIIEKQPEWRVYGVGITQQSNVVRAMNQLGLIDDYQAAGFGFDAVEVYAPDGERLARIPSPKLVEGLPANFGIGRRALHEALLAKAQALGAKVHLGLTVAAMDDDGHRVSVRFSDGSVSRHDLVIGADGLHSQVRGMLFPDAPEPQFTGQGVWRHNFPRPADMDCLQTFEGPIGLGLAPLNHSTMYMFVTTPEPGNPQYEKQRLASAMRSKLQGVAPRLASLAETIHDNDAVVYRPLDWVFLDGLWHKGRVVLLGDAVHATTPHLGQGAGMAIEDAIVLAEELGCNDSVEAALIAYRNRRYDRCKYIVEASLALCRGQLGVGPRVEQSVATREMFAVVSKPI